MCFVCVHVMPTFSFKFIEACFFTIKTAKEIINITMTAETTTILRENHDIHFPYLPTVLGFPGLSRNLPDCPGVQICLRIVPDFQMVKVDCMTPPIHTLIHTSVFYTHAPMTESNSSRKVCYDNKL